MLNAQSAQHQFVPISSTPLPPFNPAQSAQYNYAGSPPTTIRKHPNALARPVTRNTEYQAMDRSGQTDLTPYLPRTWLGPRSPGLPRVFAPHLRTNEHLKAYGWPANFFRLYLRRVDGTPQKMVALRTSIKASTKFQQMTGSVAIPGVYVPTSLANQYRGKASI